MKLIRKKVEWGNYIFSAGNDGKYSLIEFHNIRGPAFKVVHHVEDLKFVGRPNEKLIITFNSMSQRKSLIRGLRFMADVLDNKYDGIETEEG